LKIEKSHSSFWQAFDRLHPNCEEGELQYMIAEANRQPNATCPIATHSNLEIEAVVAQG
jgi:hypothetical protein